MNFQGAKKFFGAVIPAFFLIGCASQEPNYSGSTENLIEETAVQEIYEPAAPRVEAENWSWIQEISLVLRRPLWAFIRL